MNEGKVETHSIITYYSLWSASKKVFCDIVEYRYCIEKYVSCKNKELYATRFKLLYCFQYPITYIFNLHYRYSVIDTSYIGT